MNALVMLTACGCVWGIETSTRPSHVGDFMNVARQAGRTVVSMDHDEARARLFVCEHGLGRTTIPDEGVT